MKLNANKFGLAAGIFWAVILFVFTLIAATTGYGTGWLQSFVATIYPGYTVSVFGSVLGLIYGFIDGYVGCWLFAALYNKLVG
ncbi:MAG: bacteriophage holin [Patescibacteria group bacterium]|nr:bacteriophage holin [Patescibacteria group bacterium]